MEVTPRNPGATGHVNPAPGTIPDMHAHAKLGVTPDFNGVELAPEDYAFIDFIVSEVTQDGQLPFMIPVTSLPRVIRKCAQWFWRECEDATEDRWYGIHYDDIQRDHNKNAIIKLPECIETVMQIYPVKSGFGTSFGTLMRFFREPMFYATSIGSMGGVNNLRPYTYRTAERDIAWEESVARMYEFSQYKTLFEKGIRFEFSPLTHNINFMGRVDGDLILSVLQRVPLKDLYNYDLFQSYVTACCLERIKLIGGQFNMPLPGDVSIEWSEIEAQGKERRKEIEEQIRADSSGADIMFAN